MLQDLLLKTKLHIPPKRSETSGRRYPIDRRRENEVPSAPFQYQDDK